MRKYISRSEAETIKIAEDFAKELKSGDVIALMGDLGAGKTAFVKGVAAAFGAEGSVSSPTFTVVNEYNGDIDIYHFDAYRLENMGVDHEHFKVRHPDLSWVDYQMRIGGYLAERLFSFYVTHSNLKIYESTVQTEWYE